MNDPAPTNSFVSFGKSTTVIETKLVYPSARVCYGKNCMYNPENSIQTLELRAQAGSSI